MDEKRKPFENEVPKHKKKSKNKGQPRADHKHEYRDVILHSWWNNPFKHGVVIENMEICKVCTICGRIGDYITGRFFGLNNSEYNTAEMEHWMVDDYFDKFAKKME